MTRLGFELPTFCVDSVSADGSGIVILMSDHVLVLLALSLVVVLIELLEVVLVVLLVVMLLDVVVLLYGSTIGCGGVYGSVDGVDGGDCGSALTGGVTSGGGVTGCGCVIDIGGVAAGGCDRVGGGSARGIEQSADDDIDHIAGDGCCCCGGGGVVVVCCAVAGGVAGESVSGGVGVSGGVVGGHFKGLMTYNGICSRGGCDGGVCALTIVSRTYCF